MSFEDTISELVDAAGPALGSTEVNLSSGCFSSTPPINPINQLILSVFGDNYFPPYSTQFQPEKKEELTNEKLLQMQLPGGGKIRPIATPLHNSIADYITPITGILGNIFNFFGPIFIILDVIRGLVDVLCSFFSPVPAIVTIVDLFVTILPPAIALYPPLSSILLALNTVKLILSIVAALVAHIAPIIEKLVTNALSIPVLLAQGNLAAIEGVTAKICTLITHLENEVGSLGPIKFIIELLTLFINLGAKFFCVKGFNLPGNVQDSPCCTDETCPPVIVNPPAGRAVVIRDQNRFSLLDLVNFGYEAVFPITSVISDLIEVIVNTLIGGLEDGLNTLTNAVEPAITGLGEGISSVVTAVNNTIGGILDLLNSATFFAFSDQIEQFQEDNSIQFSAEAFSASLLNIDLPEVDIPAPRNLGEAIEALPLLVEALAVFGFSPETITDILDSVVFVQPQMEIRMLTTGGNNVVSQPNVNGNLSEVGVGHIYNVIELQTLQNFIVEPEKIPASQVEDDPASLRCRMQKLDALGNPVGDPVIAPVAIPPKNILGQYIVTGDPLSNVPFLGSDIYPGDQLVLRADDFEVGDNITFSIEPDYIALLSLNLIGFGCHPDISSAASGLVALINADTDAAVITGGDPNITGFDPLRDKIGTDFPPPPLDDLQDCLALQAADPTINQTDCFADIIGDYIQDLTDFYDATLCVGVSRIQSPFEANKNFAVADGKDSITITLGVRDAGGNNLLLGIIPTSTARVEWTTTNGTFGPTIFDDETGTYSVTLTSEDVGSAEVFASFIVNDNVCMRPGLFDGFVVTDNILNLEFIREQGKFPRRRRRNQYVQSRGGRRR